MKKMTYSLAMPLLGTVNPDPDETPHSCVLNGQPPFRPSEPETVNSLLSSSNRLGKGGENS